MITKNLFDSILIKPIAEGEVDKLFIVSGYASAAMASYHLKSISEIRKNVDISLIVGMCREEGMSLSNHRAFRQLSKKGGSDSFKCAYVYKEASVHSKVYTWCKGGKPVYGFIGSANYTQKAFGTRQREVMNVCDPAKGLKYFRSISLDSIPCINSDVENFVTIHSDRTYVHRIKTLTTPGKDLEEVATRQPIEFAGLQCVKSTLLDRNGNLPQISGLNWGHRLKIPRERNQAYIRLPSTIYKTDFFPEIKVHFTLLTDDEKMLICSRAQANGKAIHSPHNNSLIGEYFRRRLNISFGQLISTDDLLRYGRTDVDFYKIDSETYYMDFSVPSHG